MTPKISKTCLVTGACGFLGSRIAAEFGGAGYDVVGVDRGSSAPAGFTGRFVQLDLPSDALAALVAETAPDVVVNAAGPASVAGSIEDPLSDFHGTIDVLMCVLDALRVSAVPARLVTMSSAAVYGNPASLPVREDAALVPVSPYGFHREIAETLLAEFSSAFGVTSCAARVFSAYGPGLRRQILWDVCKKAAENPVVELSGTGGETRDFVHAADVARAVRVLAEKAPMRGEAYNVGSGRETTISSLATRLAALVAPGASVRFSGVERAGDPLHWRADISAIEDLGFEPQVELDHGLAEFASWFAEVTRR